MSTSQIIGRTGLEIYGLEKKRPLREEVQRAFYWLFSYQWEEK
jgi:hypothetical protein